MTSESRWAVSWRPPPDVRRQMEALARLHDRSLSAEITQACRLYVREQNDPGWRQFDKHAARPG